MLTTTPIDFAGHGTGALRRRMDARDWDLATSPRVAGAMAGPTPNIVDHGQYVSIYNQGATPACVAFSIATEQTAYQRMDDSESMLFDAMQVYRDCGGNGTNGIYTDVALKYAVAQGLPSVDYTARRKLQSYSYTTDPAVICAALAANQLCVFAWLLPTDFMQGTCGLGQPTTAYHQTLATGYDRPHGRLLFANSWGSGYGQKGFGSVPFSYLTQPALAGYWYAYSTADVLDKPTPTPLLTDEQLLRSSYDVLGNGYWGNPTYRLSVATLRAQLAQRLKIV